MTRQRFTRRQVLAAAGLPALQSARVKLRLGGPVFLKTEDPEQLAEEYKRLGYSAAYCPAANPEDTDRTRAIESAFRKRDIVIAEVGAWVNMLDSDAAKRAANLKYVQQRLRLAEAVGARCCVDIAGSLGKELWYGPDPRNVSAQYFDATVENCRAVLDEVRPSRTTFAIEMSPWNLPDGPKEALRLLRAVDRPKLSVHLDIVNIINSPRRLYDNVSLINESYSLLGRWIASCHVKDLAWSPGMHIHFREVVPGRGKVDHRAWLAAAARYASSAPLMLEHLTSAEEYDEGRNYILKLGRELNLEFA